MIKQTGLLFRVRPTDYIVGYTPIDIPDMNKNADWTKYLPSGERQNNLDFFFDTLSCSTFSGLNSVETQIKYFVENNLLNKEYLDYIKELGFDINNFNCSDRFTAIMSGTTRKGNYLQYIWDSFRKDGLLPEQDLPFNKSFKSFEEYHDMTKITPDMINKAKKILDIFEFNYIWAVLDKSDIKDVPEILKKAPLHSAVNSKPHAVMIYKNKYFFNSYEPYIGNKVKSIQFALLGVVKIKDINKLYTTTKLGSTGIEVKKLQRKLKLNDDGIFGKITQKHVMEFQIKNNLGMDGVVGPKTREALNNL